MKSDLDSQTIEIIGRNILVDALLQAGLEVAMPIRDRGVDLIAYADLSSKVNKFTATPIQMKAASVSSFGVDRKYKKISELLLVYLWNVTERSKTVMYALHYDEAVDVAERMAWTKTLSWERAGYSTSHPSKKLIGFLEPFMMKTAEQWWKKIVSSPRLPD